jgi:hypothetical protein
VGFGVIFQKIQKPVPEQHPSDPPAAPAAPVVIMMIMII